MPTTTNALRGCSRNRQPPAHPDSSRSHEKERQMTANLSRRPRHWIQQPAFTLLEMLIAMALTLIMVGAIAQFYAYVGETVKDARAMIELNGHMRAAVQRLKTDLDCVTAQAIPWADEGSGYITIFEGI